jgi:Arc/MetJ-type ribon-helix-helix transcriptional regulator
MTVSLNPSAEELIQKQLESGAFANASEAVEAAVWQAFGAEATPELEALLDEALNHSGRRVPLEELASLHP